MHNYKLKKIIFIAFLLILEIVIVYKASMLMVDQPKINDGQIETYAEEDSPKIKVLTFNTGGPGERDRQGNINRWEILANFVKQENIEVVMLQEQMFTTDIAKTNDIEYIKEVFGRIYPMYSVNLQFRKIEGNVILSKYPFEEGTYKTWQIKGNRFPQSIKINTPYGILRVVNIHTHNTEACKNSRDIFKPLLDSTNELYSPPNEDILIAGDFNVVVKKHKGELVTESCRDMSFKPELDLLLKQVNADCVSNVCTNIWPERKNAYGFIDLGVTLKSSPLKILYTINNDTTKSIGDGHPPILIEVTSPNWKFPEPSPVPTVTPSLAPSIAAPTISPTLEASISPIPSVASTSYPVDLDEDGDIGINDFMKFAEYYKTSNCLIDFNKNLNCKDIEDFQIFVREYKSSIK